MEGSLTSWIFKLSRWSIYFLIIVVKVNELFYLITLKVFYYVLMVNIIFHLKNKLNLTILFQIDKQISLEASKSISWLWTLCSGWYNVNFIFHYYSSLFFNKAPVWRDSALAIWSCSCGIEMMGDTSRQLIGWSWQVSYHSRTWCNVLTGRSLTLVQCPQ